MDRGRISYQILIRLVSLISIGLLFMPLVLLPLREIIFLHRSVELRKMESRSERLEEMIFTPEEYSGLEFERDGREFRYRGNMYDIHSVEKSDTRIVVLAFLDSHETKLIKAFQNQKGVDGAMTSGGLRMGFLAYFQIEFYHLDIQAIPTDHSEIRYIQSIYSDPGHKICSPPPRIV
jgi:hypothetical protein